MTKNPHGTTPLVKTLHIYGLMVQLSKSTAINLWEVLDLLPGDEKGTSI